MIIRITFEDGLIMLFGDSYKKWDNQFEEFFHINKNELSEITKVEYSQNLWVSWGGLKWCKHDDFQSVLNREGCQNEELDNLNPRKYNDMIFNQDEKITNNVMKIVKKI